MDDRTLVLGRTGSGKTTYLRRNISWAGEHLDTLIVAAPTIGQAMNVLRGQYNESTGSLTDYPDLDLQITTLSRPRAVKATGRTLAVVDEAELAVLDELVNHLKCEIIATATIPGEKPEELTWAIHPYERDHNRLGLTVAYALDNGYRLETLRNW